LKGKYYPVFKVRLIVEYFALSNNRYWEISTGTQSWYREDKLPWLSFYAPRKNYDSSLHSFWNLLLFSECWVTHLFSLSNR
jgi:hypothetical protein